MKMNKVKTLAKVKKQWPRQQAGAHPTSALRDLVMRISSRTHQNVRAHMHCLHQGPALSQSATTGARSSGARTSGSAWRPQFQVSQGPGPHQACLASILQVGKSETGIYNPPVILRWSRTRTQVWFSACFGNTDVEFESDLEIEFALASACKLIWTPIEYIWSWNLSLNLNVNLARYNFSNGPILHNELCTWLPAWDQLENGSGLKIMNRDWDCCSWSTQS